MSSSLTCALLCSARAWLLPGHDRSEALPGALRDAARLLTLQREESLQWGEYLQSLDDEEVALAEAKGLRSFPAPATLLSFVDELRRLQKLLLDFQRPTAVEIRAFRMKQKKAEQVAGCLEVLQEHMELTKVRRVLDLGAGAGALTWAVAEALQRPALGLDRDPAQVARAEERWGSSSVAFSVCDVQRASELQGVLRQGDLVLGLHPCGSLGDQIIEALAASPLHLGLLLVSCCLQGHAWAPVPELRPAVSHLGQELKLRFCRSELQLGNLWGRGRRSRGVLLTRLALRRLLELRGRVVVSPKGPSLRGLGNGPWEQQAAKAMTREGLAAPSCAEISECWSTAGRELPRARRLALLMPLQGRLAELGVSLDRGCALQESGCLVSLASAFSSGASPRNCAILGGKKSPKHRPREAMEAEPG